MTVGTAETAAVRPRRRRPGTAHRRHLVVLELLLITATYLVVFFLLISHMRYLEVHTIAGLFSATGSRGVTVAGNDSLLIAPSHQQPILATISSSCSALMGILALCALAIAVLRRNWLNTLLAFIVAAIILFAANVFRMTASALAGLHYGNGALILFHNWVGTVWNFGATLLGFLLLVYLTLPTLEHSEQDRRGRHSAHRPESWARVGLGYRVPMLAGARPRQRDITGWMVRHLLPATERRKMARQREAGRIDYRVGYLDVDQRRQAIARLADDGLGTHGATLLAIARYEEDMTVLDALSAAVAEHLGEATEDPVAAMLAFWARGWQGVRDHESGPPPIPEPTWRLLAGRHSLRRTRHELARLAQLRERPAPDELEALALEGLEYHKLPFLALAASATDPAVLRALSRAIATRQWEPTLSDGGIALRLFARAYLTVPVQPARRGRESDPTAAGDRAGNGKTERTRVAVTGVGGPAGFAVCRALQAAGHEVVGLDPDPLATGFRLDGVESVIGPRADDEHLGERILELVSTRHFRALISTVAEELPTLIAIAPELAARGCATWFPPLSAVGLCLDKARFAETMRDYGIPHPPTATTVRGSRRVPAPFVVKPRRGRGSRGVAFIDDRKEMRQALRKDHDLVVQSRLLGEEWTADILVDRNGQLVGCVPRWRLEVRGGISVKGVTFDSQDVTRACAEALAAVGLTGIGNVQGVLDPTGHAAVIEINPRFSGGLPLSLEAGSDFVGAYLGAILHPDRRIAPLFFRPGTTMVRHFEEMFEAAPSDGDGDSDGGAAPSTS